MINRNKGTGCIYYREDRNVFEGRIRIGWKPSGKSDFKYVTRKTKTEVQKELTRIMALVDEGTYIKESNLELTAWLIMWLETYLRSNIKEQTYNSYKMVIEKFIYSFLKGVRLKDLTPLRIQSMFNKLAEKYAPSTLRKIKQILNSALNKAVENDMLAKSPLIGIKLPKISKPIIEVLTCEEIGKLEKTAKEYQICEAIEIAVRTGLRIGELLALEWSDVDYDNEKLNVNKTLVKRRDDSGKEVLALQRTLKTENSLRIVPLNEESIAILKALKKKRCRQGFRENDIVFCSTRGTYISPRNFNRALDAICKKANIKQITANVLRHTFATIAIERNSGVKAVSCIMGHTNIKTTYDNYVHPSDKRLRETVNNMSFHLQTD